MQRRNFRHNSIITYDDSWNATYVHSAINNISSDKVIVVGGVLHPKSWQNIEKQIEILKSRKCKCKIEEYLCEKQENPKMENI